ncbi:serine kinase [Pseudomonas alkylphenolica]|uniref:Serine kinase n=1 Tax=Pseudomonas alkylphenolica TaxID=237609 RepID=A0A443ZX92_9PSED|nr:phosphotransferase [Pseudomonas alkylphenolica]RWU25272.1 serine kinase [Pseudomonas alkylphenolica]
MTSDTLIHASPAVLDCFAQRALARYASSYQGQIELLVHSENATYCVKGARQRFVLRVHRAGYHQHADIASELAWLAALQATGLEVPVPIAGLDGEAIQVVELPGHGSRFVVLFHWIDGGEPDQQQLNASFRRLGEINASLHRHARSWQRPSNFQRLTWNHESMLGEQGHWGRWSEAPYLDARASALIGETVEVIGERLCGYGEDPSRFGLIHADLRLTNLLVQGDRTRIIDFDDCGMGWYLHDLAAALSFFEHHPDLLQWIDNWLEGYSRVASLDARDIAMLPTLIMQRRLQLLAWTGTHRGTPQVECLGPVWVEQTVGLCHRYLEERPVGALAQA